MEQLLRGSDELIGQIKAVAAAKVDAKDGPTPTAGITEELNAEVLQIKQQLALIQKALTILQRQQHLLYESFKGSFDRETRLTAREKQILTLLKQGLDNKDMAIALNLGVQTVKNHMRGVFEKLGIKSRAQVLHTPRKVQFEPDLPPRIGK